MIATSLVLKPGADRPERDGTRANTEVRRNAIVIAGPAPRGMSLVADGALIATGIEASDPFSRTP